MSGGASSGANGGWFPDPTGRFGQRWYDGHRWTDQVVAANGATITDPLPESTTPLAPPVARPVQPPPAPVGAGAPGAPPSWQPQQPFPQPFPQPGPQSGPQSGPSGAATTLRPGATLVLALLGLAVVAACLFGLPWASSFGESVTFLDFSDAARQVSGGGEPVLRAYAAWGGFVLLALTLVGAVLAGVPLPGRPAAARTWRILTAGVAGLAAVLHTVTVVRAFRGPEAPEVGAWVAVAGYFLVIVALVVGHYRRSPARA